MGESHAESTCRRRDKSDDDDAEREIDTLLFQKKKKKRRKKIVQKCSKKRRRLFEPPLFPCVGDFIMNINKNNTTLFITNVVVYVVYVISDRVKHLSLCLCLRVCVLAHKQTNKNNRRSSRDA